MDLSTDFFKAGTTRRVVEAKTIAELEQLFAAGEHETKNGQHWSEMGEVEHDVS